MCVVEIEFAEEDKLVSAYTTPNDPGVTQQWALYQLGLFTDSPLENGLVEQGAWNRTYGGDVIVCIIDSGVDYTHPGKSVDTSSHSVRLTTLLLLQCPV